MNAPVEIPPALIAWQPFPGRQTAFVTCPVEDIFFGGARGPGKTQGILGKWLLHADRYRDAARGLIVRQSFPQLQDMEMRADELFSRFPRGFARYNGSNHVWRFANGARLLFGYLDTEDDARRYKGQEFSLIAADELTEWATLGGINKLRACLRSTKGAHCQFIATSNPGGPGHNAVKFRYVDQQARYGLPFRACGSCDVRYRDDRAPACDCPPLPDGTLPFVDRVFIPSTLRDNPILSSDPQYMRQLIASANGDEALLDAWLNGNWAITSGGMLDDLWRHARPVIPPFDIPETWYVDRGFDPGSTHPYACLWFAESSGEDVRLRDGTTRSWPRGTLFVIGEDYGWTGKPNDGLRLPASVVAERIKAAEARLMAGLRLARRPQPGPADTNLWAIRGGRDEAAEMAQAGVNWVPAAKGPGSRVPGWKKVRQLLMANCDVDAATGRVSPRTARMEQPGLFVFDTCPQTIRTVEHVPRDARNRDDVDTESEDHCADVIRYRATAHVHRGGVSRVVRG